MAVIEDGEWGVSGGIGKGGEMRGGKGGEEWTTVIPHDLSLKLVDR